MRMRKKRRMGSMMTRNEDEGWTDKEDRKRGRGRKERRMRRKKEG